MNSQNLGSTTSPYVVRAGKARDLLVKHRLGAQVRVITYDAGRYAQGDHTKYIAYVYVKIAQHLNGLSAVFFDEAVQVAIDMIRDGFELPDIIQYLARNYGVRR
jgi:hypothetical protein